jgi:hypothetical protein
MQATWAYHFYLHARFMSVHWEGNFGWSRSWYGTYEDTTSSFTSIAVPNKVQHQLDGEGNLNLNLHNTPRFNNIFILFIYLTFSMLHPYKFIYTQSKVIS